ncbi:hypothetical protein T07_12729 [Trichinella nelsoni]|uniref:Uncharacterized protein n=1 Tax=Trichinella nelsoni TaxID=6336 RepID=A0A0V0RHA9_9BILA|nr:hypothetical protein T07_12729 [Trichinella nelsoni]
MLCILREVGNKVRRKSHSTFSLLRCCILSVMSPMNPVSQRCVVAKGTNIRILSKLSLARMLNCDSMATS